MANALFCIVDDQSKAERIFEELRSSGFSTSDISLWTAISSDNATAGSVAARLAKIGVPPAEAHRLETSVRDGNILMGVQCKENDLCEKAEVILKNAGARNICRVKTDGKAPSDAMEQEDELAEQSRLEASDLADMLPEGHWDNPDFYPRGV